jgi:hypothetical protein
LIIAPGFLHQFGKKCKMAGAKTSQMTDAGQSEIVTVEQMIRRPAGKSIAGALLEKQIHPQIIEMNPKSARKAEKMGLSVFLGDAPHSEVLLHAGIQKSAAVVVTVPDRFAHLPRYHQKYPSNVPRHCGYRTRPLSYRNQPA